MSSSSTRRSRLSAVRSSAIGMWASAESPQAATAEDVGAYKPRPPHFEALFTSLPELGVDRNGLLHVAQSLYHDHEPAQRYGLPSVWIDRGHGRFDSGATPKTDPSIEPRWRFPTLEAFADAVEAPL